MPKAPTSTDSKTSTASTGKPSGRRKKKPEANESLSEGRPVLYPEISTRIFLASKDTPFTDEYAKKLVGWETEGENVKFHPDEILLQDTYGRNVRMTCNAHNRPFYYSSVCVPLIQEILNKVFRMNCENRIIGKTGIVLNGQHTFAALILAAEIWEKEPEKYKDLWPTRPTIDTIIAFGCDEDDETVNTMDTCKSRSLMDVVFRSRYFRDLKKKDRIQASRRLADCIKLLWHRTGASADAFRPKRTHAESCHFIERHPRIVGCVQHVTEENGADNRIGRYIQPGYAAALLYLMGSCDTERENKEGTGYTQTRDPNERQLNWNRWDEARDFWTRLAANDVSMNPIREALGRLYEEDRGSIDEKLALIVKAWLSQIEDGEILEDRLQLEYETDGEGVKRLVETPAVGGVDLGKPD